jgi:hypothetical protein
MGQRFTSTLLIGVACVLVAEGCAGMANNSVPLPEATTVNQVAPGNQAIGNAAPNPATDLPGFLRYMRETTGANQSDRQSSPSRPSTGAGQSDSQSSTIRQTTDGGQSSSQSTVVHQSSGGGQSSQQIIDNGDGTVTIQESGPDGSTTQTIRRIVTKSSQTQSPSNP